MARHEPPASVADSAADMDSDETAREQRLRVLHQLAQQAAPLARPANSLGAKPIRLTREEIWRIADHRAARRKRLAQGIGVVLVLLALGAVLRPYITLPSLLPGASRSATPPPTVGPLVIDLARDGIGCLSDTTWSQQGTSVAVIGNPSCTQSPGSANPDSLNIYDGTTGRLVQQFKLDDAIQPALLHATGGPNHVVFFQHLLWTFQGTLAVTFFVQVTDASAPSPFYAGLMLVSPDGSSPQVLVQHMPDQVYAYHVLWDLTTGKASVLKNAVAGDRYSLASLPPALTYHWGNGGQFVVDRPLPPNPADPSAMLQASMQPIGDPVASLVSVWQPGEVLFTPGDSATPAHATWTIGFAAWSPAMDFLLDAVTLTGFIQLSGQTPLDPTVFGDSILRFAPVLPTRDAGLQATLSTLQRASASSTISSTQAALVAWRPDGALLATRVSPELVGQISGAGPVPVTLFDCISGKTVATLNVPLGSASGGPVGVSQMRWSPDGARLLVYTPSLHSLAIWGPSALPR